MTAQSSATNPRPAGALVFARVLLLEHDDDRDAASAALSEARGRLDSDLLAKTRGLLPLRLCDYSKLSAWLAGSRFGEQGDELSLVNPLQGRNVAASGADFGECSVNARGNGFKLVALRAGDSPSRPQAEFGLSLRGVVKGSGC